MCCTHAMHCESADRRRELAHLTRHEGGFCEEKKPSSMWSCCCCLRTGKTETCLAIWSSSSAMHLEHIITDGRVLGSGASAVCFFFCRQLHSWRVFGTDRRGVIRWNVEYGKPRNKIMREIQRVPQLQMVLKCIPINPVTGS